MQVAVLNYRFRETPKLAQISRSVKAANQTHRLCYVEDLCAPLTGAKKMPKAGV